MKLFSLLPKRLVHFACNSPGGTFRTLSCDDRPHRVHAICVSSKEISIGGGLYAAIVDCISDMKSKFLATCQHIGRRPN
jgi:hypothetical protein